MRKHIQSLLCLGLALVASHLVAAEVDPYDQSKVPLEVDSTDPKLAKIVLLAGSRSNNTGQHEYFAGCALMMDWLKQTPGIFPVMAREGWPKNEKILEGAKSVVLYMDGGGKQTFLEPERAKLMQKLVDSGVGIVMLHQIVDFPQGPDQMAKSWLGAVWFKDIGCRGHWDMSFKDFPDHPVMRGVKPFTAPHDGWLYNLHFADGMKGVTPLIVGEVPDKSRSTADAKAHNGRGEIIGWAYERPDGGRSFGYTGCDLHKNWDIESQRKLVINGILWTAKVEIPKDGAKVDFDPASLNTNLDDKRKAAAKKAE